MNEVRTFLSIADHAEWWPDILRQTPHKEENGTNKLEQVLLWDAMESGKAPWVAALRAASDTVIDRIAWTAIRELIPDYEAMRMSTSWLITKPLRNIAGWLRNMFN